MSRTLSEHLAEFGHSLTYTQIPDDVLEKSKQLILDTTAIGLASTRMPFGQDAIQLISSWGGAPQATVFGTSTKIPAQNAALCNGILAHGQDYDDTHTEAVVHPTAALFPVALAIAEQTGANGRDLLTALIAGTEAAIRIALPIPNKFHQHGFHTTTVTTIFGAALLTARLKGYDKKKTTQAIGIAGSFVAGLVECVPAGADSKRLHAGWGGMCGVIAAQFAEIGYSGPATVFEGKLGLYRSLLAGEAFPNAPFDSLGQSWEILNIRPKLYPCCHYLQAFIDCAKALRSENAIDPARIRAIDCRVAEGAVNIVCEPWNNKLKPTTAYGARFSLPYAVSLMLAKGNASSSGFSDEFLADPDISKLSEKVRYKVDSNYQVKDMPAWLQVTTDDGRTFTHELRTVRGDKANPIQANEIREKFDASTNFINPRSRDRLANAILSLDQADNMAQFAGLLSNPAGIIQSRSSLLA